MVVRRRRPLRLPAYDYSTLGAYFVTICIRDGECLFGDVVDGEVCLSDSGRIVHAAWESMPTRFVPVSLDAFVAMPNHVHCIVWLTSPVGAGLAPPSATLPVGGASPPFWGRCVTRRA
jgi:putative transposase